MRHFVLLLSRTVLPGALILLLGSGAAQAQSWSIERTSPNLRGVPQEYDLYRGGQRVGRLEESMPGLPTLRGMPQEFDVFSRSGRRIGTAEIDRTLPGFPDATIRLDRGRSFGIDVDDD